MENIHRDQKPPRSRAVLHPSFALRCPDIPLLKVLLLPRENDKGDRCRELTFCFHIIFSFSLPSHNMQIFRLLPICGFLHSLLANHCSSECQECRDQSINKCLLNVCCLGEDVVLLSAKNTVSERGIKSIVLPQALKFNLPTFCSYQHLREGSQMSWE